jgi:subtilisin family serine protease
MFARKNGRQFQKSNAPVAAEQFEERQLMTAAVVDSGWFAEVKSVGASTRTQSLPNFVVQLQDGFANSPAQAQLKLATSGVNVVSGLGARGAVAVSFSGSLEALRQVPGVVSASPNSRMQVTSVSDPMTGSLWGHNKIDATGAWDKTDGAAGTVVAVLDTGIDLSHPDLASAVYRNTAEIAGNGIDDDGNGFADDVHGYDFLNNDNDPSDDNFHGTHVSGTIAAVVNGSGMQGVAYGAQILPLKFLGAGGSGALYDAIRAVNYTTLLKQRGVNITAINASFSGGGYSQAFYDAIQSAGANGIVFVASAGNDNKSLDENNVYPASYDLPNVVTVGSTQQDDARSDFSNFGNRVDIAAPGTAILSTVPGGGYGYLSGTSMAAPHVAGAIAMVKATNPGFTMTQAIDALFSSADVVAGLNVQGGRRLNLAKAVGATPTPPAVPAPTAPSNLRVTDLWQKAADVRWNDSQNETGYRVEVREGNGAFRTVANLTADAVRYRVNELTPGRAYTVRVTALNGSGSAFADISFTTAVAPPNAPVSLRTTNIWATKADLAWSLPSQNHTEVRIWKMNSRGRWELVTKVEAAATSFRLTGLAANSQTRIRISVWNTAGEAFSNEITFRTKA